MMSTIYFLQPGAHAEVQRGVDFQFLSQLMISYNASTSLLDRTIFESLQLLENTYKVNLSIICPLVWGEKSIEIYKKRGQFGATLNRTSADQVLEFLDGLRMWKTVLNHSRPLPEGEQGDVSNLYDVRFLLRLFLSLMHAGSELKYRSFVEHNGLSLSFSCTSSKDIVVRRLAYSVLQRFLSLLQELDADSADDKQKYLYVYLLRLFKQSIESDAPRLPHMISHFFARVSKLMLHPESPVFTAVLSFLSLKPVVELNNVPELYKMLLSSSAEHHHQEREWVLTLISEGLIEPMDYNILQNRSGVKLLLSLFPTCMVDMAARRLILNILKTAVRMPSVGHDLFYRMSLHSWIASVIDNRLLTGWERCYLGQIYSILIDNEREISRHSSTDNPKYRYKVASTCTRITAQKVLAAMESLSSKETAGENVRAIQSAIDAKWRPKRKKPL
ncbi:hypothetical protein Y032_0105g3694 [Ancylostoma ceylanicum]|uniref:URB1 C-terminal domain-containing protein n=1 Tax=Ancylostoma ceylanicum TaxID=53326 RepID=A0A016TG92_9BILA|nr:hypothetical protein Y032_0105g3694 [Ancylostoma ceylanicum]